MMGSLLRTWNPAEPLAAKHCAGRKGEGPGKHTLPVGRLGAGRRLAVHTGPAAVVGTVHTGPAGRNTGPVAAGTAAEAGTGNTAAVAAAAVFAGFGTASAGPTEQPSEPSLMGLENTTKR